MNKSIEYNIGAHIIEQMINVQHPLIMVDRIIKYSSQNGGLEAKKYISGNEPVFSGHFPGFKLWPGVFTIEGLRQSTLLYLAMQKIETKGLLGGVLQVQLQNTLGPCKDKELCESTLNYIKYLGSSVKSIFEVRVKLLVPVFPGCVIVYKIQRDQEEKNSFFVKALVDQRVVAEGKVFLKDTN